MRRFGFGKFDFITAIFLYNFFCFFLYSCSLSNEENSGEVAFDETMRAKILINDGKCSLVLKGSDFSKKMVFNILPPCFFVGNQDSAQYYLYPDKGIDKVYLAVGKEVDDNQKKEWGVYGKTCGSQLQAILIVGKEVRLSNRVTSGGVFCKNSYLDEKNFAGFIP